MHGQPLLRVTFDQGSISTIKASQKKLNGNNGILQINVIFCKPVVFRKKALYVKTSGVD